MLIKKTCTVEVSSEVKSVIYGLLEPDIEHLYEKYGFHIDGYKHHPLVKLHQWDGKVRFFTKKGVTYTLLLPEIIKYLNIQGYEIQFDDLRTTIVYDIPPIENDFFGDCVDKYNNQFLIRDYQVESINVLLRNINGIIVAGTGAGKATIVCALAKALSAYDNRVLIIVPNTSLIEQIKDDFNRFGLEVGEYSGNNKNIDPVHVVSTWQAIQHHPEIMYRFTAVIVDECHGARGNVLQEILIEYGSHIGYRYGVTGTMPKNLADKHTVLAALGPVRKTITTKWLQDNGYLATLDIMCIVLKEHVKLDNFLDYASEASTFNAPERLLWISSLIEKIKSQADTDNNILCLFTNKKTGKELSRLVEGSIYLDGDVKTKNRKDVYEQFEHANGMVAFATYGIASTGISIDRIHHLILIDPGKSFIRVLQSIGRGVRKGGGKTHINVYDVSSNLSFSSKHRKDRQQYYVEAEYPFRNVYVDYHE